MHRKRKRFENNMLKAQIAATIGGVVCFFACGIAVQLMCPAEQYNWRFQQSG